MAYLWARIVTCKQCRATLPLLKTRWLCKKDRKRVLLTMEPKADQTGVVFGVQSDVPHNGGNAAQRREHDKRIGAGTMSRTGATCPCCGAITTMADIRFEGRAGRLGAVMTVVVVDGPKGKGKEYRLPMDHERLVAEVTEEQLQALYADIPFGLPEEPIIEDAKRNTSRVFNMEKLPGGNCLRIGSYWPLALLFVSCVAYRSNSPTAHPSGERHWSPCACLSSVAWLIEEVRWRHGPTIPKK